MRAVVSVATLQQDPRAAWEVADALRSALDLGHWRAISPSRGRVRLERECLDAESHAAGAAIAADELARCSVPLGALTVDCYG